MSSFYTIPRTILGVVVFLSFIHVSLCIYSAATPWWYKVKAQETKTGFSLSPWFTCSLVNEAWQCYEPDINSAGPIPTCDLDGVKLGYILIRSFVIIPGAFSVIILIISLIGIGCCKPKKKTIKRITRGVTFFAVLGFISHCVGIALTVILINSKILCDIDVCKQLYSTDKRCSTRWDQSALVFFISCTIPFLVIILLLKSLCCNDGDSDDYEEKNNNNNNNNISVMSGGRKGPTGDNSKSHFYNKEDGNPNAGDQTRMMSPNDKVNDFSVISTTGNNINNNNTTTISQGPVADFELPEGDWVFDPETKMYWSEEQYLFLSPEDCHFYDPNSNHWYNPETEVWYPAAQKGE
eukprot:Tbor_TRINITY_DN5305_c1_g4::TRINITY_DN5305_c1_g4_i1::g.4850::m.4850